MRFIWVFSWKYVVNSSFVIEIHLGFSWKYVVNWFILELWIQASSNLYCQIDSEIFWFENFVKVCSDLFIHWLILVELSPNLYCQSDFSLIQKFSDLVFWWKYVLYCQSDSARLRFFSDYSWKYVVNNSLIDSCGSKSKHNCQLDSEIFWLLLWVFLQNMWLNSSFIQNF